MSYDLAVFDPAAVPRNRDSFLAWYGAQTKWQVGRSYCDPAVCGPKLGSWFKAMVQAFPAMNGPEAAPAVDDPTVTDYCIGQSVIYAAFAWSVAEKARELTLSTAAGCGVGVFEVSSAEGELWRPSADGRLEASKHTGDTRLPWFVKGSEPASSLSSPLASLVRGHKP